MQQLAVAALSARQLAELALASGLRPVALDLFGDADTCRIAEWLPIGQPQALRIDAARLLDALRLLAQRGGVRGWIAGSGFEAQPDLLAQGAALLPLIGTAPADVQRLRDPRHFFATLARWGLPHPPVRFAPPAIPAGWLLKQADSSGGWGVQRAHRVPLPNGYWQLERPGRALSATIVANGRDAVLLGVNEQCVQPQPDRPFVFAGVVGPVPVSAAVQTGIQAAVRVLASEYRLCGLAGLDFLLQGQQIELLEVNPRPPASAGLYADAHPLRLHLRACEHGELPPPPAARVGLAGQRIVFARRPLQLGAAAAAALAAWPQVHDLPTSGSRIDAGHPLCSLSASGTDVAQVQAELTRRSTLLLDLLETLA